MKMNLKMKVNKKSVEDPEFVQNVGYEALVEDVAHADEVHVNAVDEVHAKVVDVEIMVKTL